MDTRGILMWAAFVLVCAAIYFFSNKVKKEINTDGIEADGVISRITQSGTPGRLSYDYYAVYRTEDGEETEGVISNPRGDLKVGDHVRLKYHPVHKMNCRLID